MACDSAHVRAYHPRATWLPSLGCDGARLHQLYKRIFSNNNQLVNIDGCESALGGTELFFWCVWVWLWHGPSISPQLSRSDLWISFTKLHTVSHWPLSESTANRQPAFMKGGRVKRYIPDYCLGLLSHTITEIRSCCVIATARHCKYAKRCTRYCIDLFV